MDVRVGPSGRLSTEKLMLSNWGAGEDSWESLGQQEVKSVNSKGNQSSLLAQTIVNSLEDTQILGNIEWTRVWASFGRWWRTGNPGVLPSMASQRVGHYWVCWTTTKGNQPWIFIETTDAEAPILWPPDVKNWLLGKDPDAGKDWGQKKKGVADDEVVGWHHWLNGHEFEQAPGDGEGQGSLTCCSPWCLKELDTT